MLKNALNKPIVITKEQLDNIMIFMGEAEDGIDVLALFLYKHGQKTNIQSKRLKIKYYDTERKYWSNNREHLPGDQEISLFRP